jgi:hypothetical protein
LHRAVCRGFQDRLDRRFGVVTCRCGARWPASARGALFKKKYDHVFAVEPASNAQSTIAWVHRILKDERDIVIRSRPLEATDFQIDNIRIAYVFYQSGLSINVMYTVDDPTSGGRVQALRRDGSPRGARVAVQVRASEVAAGDRSRVLLRVQERILTPDRLCEINQTKLAGLFARSNDSCAPRAAS